MPRKNKLPLGRGINRREFIQGTLVASAMAGSLPSWADIGPYPPAKTGLRGAHPGSFEVAHSIAREGKQWPVPSALTDTPYDLVVVGAGISGLATAWFYQAKYGRDKRILILDNHDDFGGHAKRNEFKAGGKTLIGYGGSQSIDSPASYSEAAQGLLRALGVKTERFYDYYDQSYFQRRKLKAGLFLNRAHFGSSRLINDDQIYNWRTGTDPANITDEYLDQFPLSETEKLKLKTLLTSDKDWLRGKTHAQKLSYLRSVSYSHCLREHLGMPDKVLDLVQERLDGWWGLGTDAISALEAWRNGLPGMAALHLPEPELDHGNEPYIFHFPDGNASVARLLVRQLIPSIAPGNSMEDVVSAAFDYGKLDTDNQAVRIRLNATAVNVENSAQGTRVVYVKDGKSHKIHARHCVLACYNAIIPYLCPSLPTAQKAQLKEQVKVPMAYVNVALNNWRAFQKAGVSEFNCPRAFYTWVSMDFPVTMGGYQYPQSADEPVVLHLPYYPKQLGSGLTAKEQYRLGRYQLLGLSFADFERAAVAQLNEALGPFGFAAEKDIAAITVNRWPHGYAYEYVDLFDPDYAPGLAPHELARKAFGHIHIGNSDSEAFAYVDGAIDAAWRVVQEM